MTWKCSRRILKRKDKGKVNKKENKQEKKRSKLQVAKGS